MKNNNSIVFNKLISLLILAFIFSNVSFSCILFLFNIQIDSGQTKWFYIAITLLIFFLFLFKSNNKLSKKIIFGSFILFIFIFLFSLTRLYFGYANKDYNSELLLLIAIIPCIILIPIILFQNNVNKLNNKTILFFDLFCTIIIFIISFTSMQVTSSGLISSNYGVIYQTISYFSAYMYALNIYLLQEPKIGEGDDINKLFVYILMMVQFFLCIIGGGRGGFVLFLILTFFMINIIKKSKIRKVLFLTLIITLFYSLFFYSTKFVNEISFNTSGFQRLLMIFTENGLKDNNRLNLRLMAINEFKNSPIIGNGLGSVFYLIGIYSHNIFTDILCETGILGLIGVILILVKYFIEVKHNYRTNSIARLMFLIFICGFTMSLFSGYSYVNIMLILPIFYQLTYSSNNIREKRGKEN